MEYDYASRRYKPNIRSFYFLQPKRYGRLIKLYIFDATLFLSNDFNRKARSATENRGPIVKIFDTGAAFGSGNSAREKEHH